MIINVSRKTLLHGVSSLSFPPELHVTTLAVQVTCLNHKVHRYVRTALLSPTKLVCIDFHFNLKLT